MYKYQYFSYESDREELKSIMSDLSSSLTKKEDIYDFGKRVLEISNNERVSYEVRFYLNAIGNIMTTLHKYDSNLRLTLKVGLMWCRDNYTYNKEYV